MATAFAMPKLGLTMQEGTITEWLVADGDDVRAGTAVLVIETDKVQTEVEAPAGGRLRQVAAVGDTLECGEVVAWLLAEGEEPPAAAIGTPLADAAPPPPGGDAPPSTPPDPLAPAGGAAPAGGVAPAAGPARRVLASPNARRVASALGVDLATVTGTGPGGRIVSEDVEHAVATAATAPTSPPPPPPPPPAAPPASMPPDAAPAPATTSATVAARTLADLLGIDVGTVPASAADGRVSRDDVAAHVRTLLASPRPAATAPAGLRPASQTPSDVLALRGMRRTIATRMTESLHGMAQLTLGMDVDMDAVIEHRKERKSRGTPPGFTDYVAAAAARALRQHPLFNSQVVAEGIALLPDIHVGVAVAVDGGLVVPVVRHADRLSLDYLAGETTRLATAARSGTLTLDDLEGATFSVTALGSYGVDLFTPIINPPNVAILGVGRLRDDTAWSDKGKPKRVTRLTLSLTWDHRVADGAPAAELAAAVKELLEDPVRLG